MSLTKPRTPGKMVFKRPQPKLTLVPPLADGLALEASKVEFSPEVKEMLREIQEQGRSARREQSDAPDAA